MKLPADNKQYKISCQYLVSSADVDFEGILRVSSLINFLIQSAWQHAEHLGWGVDALLKRNLAWVLSGFTLEIKHYPKWKETITVETWPKGVNRLFYMRDFYIRNSSGELLGKATTNWLLIDIDKRRPKLIDIDDVILHLNTMPHAIEEFVPVINFEGTTENTTDYQVRYSNVDVNQHLTTTGYIDFIFDTFDPTYISKNRPVSISVNFLKEVKFGANLKMHRKKPNEHTFLFQLEKTDEEKPLFRAELFF
jgi:medium-chain acyl-[acyl-carrier-protein] hydrolase